MNKIMNKGEKSLSSDIKRAVFSWPAPYSGGSNHMKPAKNFLGGLIFILVLVLAQPATAFQNEPNDFRGIEWGTEYDELTGFMKVTTQNRLDYYTKIDEEMSIGDAPLERVVYVFYHKKFCGAVLNFKSSPNFQTVRTTLFDLYGEGGQSEINEGRYRWSLMDVTITLEYDDDTRKGKVTYYYMPIHEKKQRGDERRRRMSPRRGS
jgi:hypothetical protein